MPTDDDPAYALQVVFERILADQLAADPVAATQLGDHARDDLLADLSLPAAEDRAKEIRSHLAALDSLAIEDLATDDDIDVDILRAALGRELFGLDDLRDASWNPMVHNPGHGLHAVMSQNFSPAPVRLVSLAGRLAAIPEFLATARSRLTEPTPAVHLDTAITQLAGTLALLAEVPRFVRDAQATQEDDPAGTAVPGLGKLTDLPQRITAAREAVIEHLAWLEDRRDDPAGDASLGTALYSAKLWMTLDTPLDANRILRQAEVDLQRVTSDLTEQAAQLAPLLGLDGPPGPDQIRAVLERLADDAPTNDTVLADARTSVDRALAFTRDHELVTLPAAFAEQLDVITMPELDRGVAVAYCQPPGPLETAELPTRFAVSPTPAGWSDQRIASFYREYNRHMLDDLAVHEAVPGHALQLAHSNAYRGRTRVRSIYRSGTFVEGWAVYAEQVMAQAGYRSEESDLAGGAFRMHQLKMQLRMLLNAVLDIRFHSGDLDEREAMRLMTAQGFQEDGEAAGKWRRVQLTSTQLCTYYVGFLEISALASDLARSGVGTPREVHDRLLSVGSPPPRHVRRLFLSIAD